MLPFNSVSFDQFILPEDVAKGKTFPPARFNERNVRLNELKEIYDSNFTRFVGSSNKEKELIKIPSGLSRSVVDTFVAIMMMSEPESEYPLRQLAADCIRDMLTYGGAVILAVSPYGEESYLQIVNPDSWYPMQDGNGMVIFEAYTSVNASTSMPDSARVTVLNNSILTRYDFAWPGISTSGQLGELREVEELGQGAQFISARSPAMGIWGESLLTDLAGPLFEITKRISQNSRVLDKNVNPLLMAAMSEGDAVQQFAADEEDPEEQKNAIVKGIVEAREEDAIRINRNLQKLDYLEYSGNLDASMEQIELARELISNMTGLPGVMDSLDSNPASGRSLMLQFLPFFAATSAMQKDLTEVLAIAVDEVMPGATVTWPHIFETLGEPDDDGITERVGDGI